MKKRILITIAVTLFAMTGHSEKAKTSREREISTTPTNQPIVIYVAEFDLDATSIQIDPAAPPAPPKLPGLLGKVLPPPPGAKKDPEVLGHDLVDSLRKTLVNELTKAGFTARRLASTNNLPTSGWLIRGVFTGVDEGNQLERAFIGFGKGKTDLQVLVDVQDLSQGPPPQLQSMTNAGGSSSSSKAPGAAPMIAEHHPAAVAAKFVLSGNDLSRKVKQTAAKIAVSVATRVKQS